MKKRLSIITGFGLFFITLLLSIGCGLSPEVATENLGNSINANENGPGSGKWNPPEPSNQDQCKQLHTADSDLIETNVRLINRHQDTILACYDTKGNRIENSDNPLCQNPIQDLENAINLHLTDLRTGYDLYNSACVPNGAAELKIPDLLKETVDPNSSSWTGCLTCTDSLINPEFAFINMSIDFSNQ